jgi:hypothetical protein
MAVSTPRHWPRIEAIPMPRCATRSPSAASRARELASDAELAAEIDTPSSGVRRDGGLPRAGDAEPSTSRTSARSSSRSRGIAEARGPRIDCGFCALGAWDSPRIRARLVRGLSSIARPPFPQALMHVLWPIGAFLVALSLATPHSRSGIRAPVNGARSTTPDLRVMTVNVETRSAPRTTRSRAATTGARARGSSRRSSPTC